VANTRNLKAAQARLSLIVPSCFVLISGPLFMALGGLAPAAVFSAIALALAGGVFALALRGLPSSVSAAVGLIALSGVAVLNGLVMITAVRHRLLRGKALDGAIIVRALERLRPVMMTGLAASLGFVPMALATESGAEVQRPLANVVIGGLRPRAARAARAARAGRRCDRAFRSAEMQALSQPCSMLRS